jgi:hypothetical protein
MQQQQNKKHKNKMTKALTNILSKYNEDNINNLNIK